MDGDAVVLYMKKLKLNKENSQLNSTDMGVAKKRFEPFVV